MNRSLVFFVVSGCVPSFPVHYSQTCSERSECAVGKLCIKQRCATPECVSNPDCGDGLCQADFTCSKDASAGTRMTITDVKGDLGARVRKSLVITGSGFDESTSVQIISALLKRTWDLQLVAPASASSITAGLPTDLAMMITSTITSDFTVRLASVAGGSAARDVSMLQGEKGDPGPPGPKGDPLAIPATVASSSDATPTLTVRNDAANGTALSLTGGVKLPLSYVSNAAQLGVYSVFARCTAGAIAITCGCFDGTEGNATRVQTVCLSNSTLSPQNKCLATAPDPADSGCHCKWDAGSAVSGDRVAYAQCLQTGI